MSDVSVAAFDPIFYLHHCQVDRLLSLWSAMNPNVWVTRSEEPDGTYTIPPGDPVDTDTALTPFWKTLAGEYWSSAAVVGTVPTELGYSYPEFEGLDLSNPVAVRAAIETKIEQLYDTAPFSPTQILRAAATASRSKSTGRSAMSNFDALQSSTHSGRSRTTVGGLGGHGPSNDSAIMMQAVTPEYWDWSVRIHIKKYEVGGSFAVRIFLGTVPVDPAEWCKSPQYVGGHHGFVSSVPNRCDNCVRQRDLVIEGFVHLDEAIAARSGLTSFEPNVVKPFLRHYLQWRVQKNNRTPVPIENVPSLEVTIIATKLTLLPGATFPVAGEVVYHHDITHGRPGGSPVMS